MTKCVCPWSVLGAFLVATNLVGVSPFRTPPPPTAPSPSPPPPLTQSIGDFQVSVNQQNIQSVLNAIEQRLRGLDNIYAARYGAGLTWETLEARLTRLETTYDQRLQTLTESLNQKYTLLTHKVDLLFEKVRYLETSQQKVQVMTTKMSEKQINLGDRVDSVSRAVLRIEHQQIRANGTLYAIEQRLQAVAVSIDSMGPGSMQTIISEGSCTLNSSDVMNEIEGAVATIREFVDRKADIVMNKASNSYNDMWRHVTSAESLAKETLSVANATRAHLEEALKTDTATDAAGAPSLRTLSRNSSPLFFPTQTDPGQLVTLLDNLAKYVSQNMKLLDENSKHRFTEITQSLKDFNDGCQGMQTEFNNKITEVLTRLLDKFGERGTEVEDLERAMQSLSDLLKSHDTHIVNVIARATKVVHNASEMSGQRDKELKETVTALFQNTSQNSKHIQQVLEGAFFQTNSSSHPEIVETINGISAAVQGLREQLDCFNSSCSLHGLLKNMSSELEKSFVSACEGGGSRSPGGSFAEKYNVTYDEAWDFILGKKNSTETEAESTDADPPRSEDVTDAHTGSNGTEAKITDAEQTGKDAWNDFDVTPLDDDEYINDDDDEASEVNYK